MLTGMIAPILFSSMDTDLVSILLHVQRHVTSVHMDRVCVEDAKPAETVNVSG